MAVICTLTVLCQMYLCNVLFCGRFLLTLFEGGGTFQNWGEPRPFLTKSEETSSIASLGTPNFGEGRAPMIRKLRRLCDYQPIH